MDLRSGRKAKLHLSCQKDDGSWTPSKNENAGAKAAQQLKAIRLAKEPRQQAQRSPAGNDVLEDHEITIAGTPSYFAYQENFANWVKDLRAKVHMSPQKITTHVVQGKGVAQSYTVMKPAKNRNPVVILSEEAYFRVAKAMVDDAHDDAETPTPKTPERKPTLTDLEQRIG
ncbi:hypothetical protein SLS56_004476 [Neofusicoccum ribis]|uniref:Uncharacterized protein n=1 Tax=Neofusicoccum ribis TaxID=45134 RepID=A0ABR3SWD3_9PEZI